MGNCRRGRSRKVRVPAGLRESYRQWNSSLTDENGNLVGDGGVHIYSNTRDLQILGSNVPDGISRRKQYI